VPPKPDAPPHASLAAATPGQSRLSIGHSRSQRASAPPPPPPQEILMQKRLSQAKSGQKGSAVKWVTASIVFIVFGAAGYFGYGYFNQWRAKRSEAAKTSATSATQQVATAAAAEAAPAPEKELPLIPPTWTLDVGKAVIPETRANGMIGGTNFVVATARLDRDGPTYLLRLLEGTTAAPDRGFMVYLRPRAGESITGSTWTIAQDTRGQNVPQVVKLWKPDPRYQAQQKLFYYGYAMKLELGEITNGVIPGRIFLAVPPDGEQSVVAGVFKAETSLANAAANAVAGSNPAAPNGPSAAGRAEFQRRYGARH
jgi:hypothetical protein